MTLLESMEKIILANELDNNTDFAYRFSDPDGVRTGKSGWSFGKVQYDIANNSTAALCLQECGFTSAEIMALKKQTIEDMAPFNQRLRDHSEIIDKWDARQIQECLSRVQEMAKLGGWTYQDDRALLMAADYHNQFYLSKGGQFFNWAKRLGAPVTDYDIYKFKMNLPWGAKRPDDVKRRYHTILKIMAGA